MLTKEDMLQNILSQN